jgi:NAD(P)-dependent dehydrogenase (short-subunit alcohol dehydrogenase family)
MEPIHSGPMASRTVLVTGGTGGIGRATALAGSYRAWAQVNVTRVTMSDRQAPPVPARMARRWHAPPVRPESLSAASGGRAARVVGRWRSAARASRCRCS